MTEFIDLGLPSGNLWATKNTPNGSNYGWPSMKAYGYVESHRCDGQIPTKKDFEELQSFCDTVYNDKLDGMVFTSKNNGRCILVPCAWDKLGCEGYITKDGRDYDNGLLRLVKHKEEDIADVFDDESATPLEKIDDQNQFCINCKHCVNHGTDYNMYCECVGLRDVVTGNVTYQLCDSARYLINDKRPNSPTCDYFEKKEKLPLRQRIKRFFCGDETPSDTQEECASKIG